MDTRQDEITSPLQDWRIRSLKQTSFNNITWVQVRVHDEEQRSRNRAIYSSEELALQERRQ